MPTDKNNTDKENINSKYDLNQEKINADHKTATDKLEREKTRAQQQQDVYNVIMQKYLPRQMRAAGLGGSGIAESNIIAMNNSHARTLADIENNYLTNKTALDTARDEALRNNESERIAALEVENSKKWANNKSWADYELSNINTEEDLNSYLAKIESGGEMEIDPNLLNRYKNLAYDALENNTKAADQTKWANNKSWADYEVGTIKTEEEKAAFIEKIKEGGEMEIDPDLYKIYEDLANKAIVENEKIAESANREAYENSEELLDLETRYQEYLYDGEFSRTEYNHLKNYGDKLFEGNASYKDYYAETLRRYENSIEYEDAAKDIPKEGRGLKGDGSIKTNVNIKITSAGGITAANGKEGDNFTIKLGPETALVERGLVAKEFIQNSINLAYGNKKPEKGEVVVYNGRIYMCLPGTDDVYNNSEGKRDDLKWVMIRPTAWGKDGFENICNMLKIGYYSPVATED